MTRKDGRQERNGLRVRWARKEEVERRKEGTSRGVSEGNGQKKGRRRKARDRNEEEWKGRKAGTAYQRISVCWCH